jgi:hypothetical protein
LQREQGEKEGGTLCLMRQLSYLIMITGSMDDPFCLQGLPAPG